MSLGSILTEAAVVDVFTISANLYLTREFLCFYPICLKQKNIFVLFFLFIMKHYPQYIHYIQNQMPTDFLKNLVYELGLGFEKKFLVFVQPR